MLGWRVGREIAPHIPVRDNSQRKDGTLARYRPAAAENFASLASDWIALAADPATLDRLVLTNRWAGLAADDRAPVWTDDFSNIIAVIRWW